MAPLLVSLTKQTARISELGEDAWVATRGVGVKLSRGRVKPIILPLLVALVALVVVVEVGLVLSRPSMMDQCFYLWFAVLC